jgi:hypothetical protein
MNAIRFLLDCRAEPAFKTWNYPSSGVNYEETFAQGSWASTLTVGRGWDSLTSFPPTQLFAAVLSLPASGSYEFGLLYRLAISALQCVFYLTLPYCAIQLEYIRVQSSWWSVSGDHIHFKYFLHGHQMFVDSFLCWPRLSAWVSHWMVLNGFAQ